MKIVCMMRVRNEARWLQEVLESIFPLTEEVLLFDDHSTDETPAIAQALGCTVIHSPFPIADPHVVDESRDKNHLLRLVAERQPDYVLSIDGDEVLEAGAAAKIRAKLNPRYGLYSFTIKYVWNDRAHYRADGVYGRYHQWRMFTLAGQTGRLFFPGGGKIGANFHCGNTPFGLTGAGCEVQADILHLGYIDPADRIRKYHWYNAPDKQPIPSSEDGYRHMVVGDVFPKDSKFLHGGPLKLFTLPAYKWPVSSERVVVR